MVKQLCKADRLSDDGYVRTDLEEEVVKVLVPLVVVALYESEEERLDP